METGTKRLNLNLSARAYSELEQLAQTNHVSMTEIVRLGIGLAKIAIDAKHRGHMLWIAKEDGEVIKELVLPGI